MSDPIAARVINATADAVGGFEQLATLLGVSHKLLIDWTTGAEKIPADVYARTVALLHGEQSA